ncbi:MAG: histidine phosphatase family protein [candidate division WS1 bacterium]|jgi:probable phosphoglycerate mutase|nr:histidine phosphatase family protein [candidate division WS1 bacterium]
MKRIVLVRHGEAEHTQEGLTGGWTESHLTTLGEQQAHVTGGRLAKMLGDVEYTLYSSDLARASETARIVCGQLGIKPVFDGDLREFNNGQAANMTWEQAQAIQNPPTQPLVDYVPYPGAENWRQMNERVSGCMARVEGECPDTAVIITHTLSGVAVVNWWLQLDADAWGRISCDFDPGSITLLTINQFGQRTISRLNDTRHLAAADCESKTEALPGVKA